MLVSLSQACPDYSSPACLDFLPTVSFLLLPSSLGSPIPFRLSDPCGDSLSLISSRKNAPLSLSNHSSPHSHNLTSRTLGRPASIEKLRPLHVLTIRAQQPAKGHPNLSTALPESHQCLMGTFLSPPLPQRCFQPSKMNN